MEKIVIQEQSITFITLYIIIGLLRENVRVLERYLNPPKAILYIHPQNYTQKYCYTKAK